MNLIEPNRSFTSKWVWTQNTCKYSVLNIEFAFCTIWHNQVMLTLSQIISNYFKSIQLKKCAIQTSRPCWESQPSSKYKRSRLASCTITFVRILIHLKSFLAFSGVFNALYLSRCLYRQLGQSTATFSSATFKNNGSKKKIIQKTESQRLV